MRPDLHTLSDEDFLNMASPDAQASTEGADPPDTEIVQQASQEGQGEDGEGDNGTNDSTAADGSNDGAGDPTGTAGADASAAGTDPASGAASGEDDPAKSKPQLEPGDQADKDGAKPAAGEPGAGESDAAKPADKPENGAEPGLKKEEGEGEKVPDYKGFYETLMGGFRANGREVKPQSIEEIRRLMEMGAGFGKKMGEIQPHLKTLRLLEKENLLDPEKLSFLIDINNKNPEAIKKIIKDANLDPLDLNIEDNVYVPTDRSVSDQEVAFHSALGELKSHPNGGETITIIDQTWDNTSKDLLWEDPKLLEVIRSQRELGVYDKIVEEIERQKTFGAISHDTPFLKAYQIAGDTLVKDPNSGLTPPPEAKAGTVTPPAPTTAVDQPAPKQVIATRAEAPKPAVDNNDKASAAAPSPSTAKKADTKFNPLALSDAEFMKQYGAMQERL